MEQNIFEYVVLFTAQKTKKFKTWQDGTMKYYSKNRKLILADEKGYVIDNQFFRGGIPSEGDEVEFEKHIATIESVSNQPQQSTSVQEQPAEPINHTRTISAQETTVATNSYNSDYRQARMRLLHMEGTPITTSTEVTPLAHSRSNSEGGTETGTRQGPGGPFRLPKRNLQQSNQNNQADRSSAAISVVPQINPVLEKTSDANIQTHVQSVEYSTVDSELEGIDNSYFEGMDIEDDQNTITTTNTKTSNINTFTTARTIANTSPNTSIRTNIRANIHANANTNTNASASASASASTVASGSTLASKPFISPIIAKSINNSSPKRTVNYGITRHTVNGESTTNTNQEAPNNDSNNTDESTLSSTRGNIDVRTKRMCVGLSKKGSMAVLHQSVSDTLSKSSNGLSESLQSAPGTSNLFVKASALPVDNPQNVAESSSRAGPSIERPQYPTTAFKGNIQEKVSVPLAIQFPTMGKAMEIIKTKKHPKRVRKMPANFKNVAEYKDTFQRLIHEHIQILLLNYAVYYYSFYNMAKKGENLERYFRTKGCGFYSSCELRNDNYSSSQSHFRIMLRSKEHHSRYSKDDVWVVSKNPKFDSSGTFMGRSVYYGPHSDGGMMIECLTPRDVRVALLLLKESLPLYAMRTIAASTEFVMLDNLNDQLDTLPIFSHMLRNKSRKGKRKADQVQHQNLQNQAGPSSPASSPSVAEPQLKLEHIQLTREDNIDVEAKLCETIKEYHLNTDQESVLRAVAKSVITSPGWNEETENPIILVHGVFGSGKSYLAAVIIIFLKDIVDTASFRREPEDMVTFKILISSMTNTAVDRILLTLVKLGFDQFVRVGSLKKITKSLLPYTAQAKLSSNDELKELEEMLADPKNTEEESEYISNAIQRFRKKEHVSQVQTADVIGTTCIASTFDILNGIHFPLVLMDECSQLMEPLNMVPLTRFGCNRLIMIGDPMQLPPTLTTIAQEDIVGQGLDKTLFDRMTEMGHQATLLRTQYRCHPRISSVSNGLFYNRRLINGVTAEDRSPSLVGLPPLIFIDVGGEERKNTRTNSFWNEAEMDLSAKIIETLLNLGISSADIGVIALYKQQADALSEVISAKLDKNTERLHISTVDSFQGGEKEIIILSTVRTSSSGFIDNHPRVNVAISRAKRHLIILGSKSLLMMNELWSNVLWECQEHVYSKPIFEKLLTQLETPK